jgi:hypothetical protein
LSLPPNVPADLSAEIGLTVPSLRVPVMPTASHSNGSRLGWVASKTPTTETLPTE